MSIFREIALFLYRLTYNLYLGFQFGIPFQMPPIPYNNLMRFEIVSGNEKETPSGVWPYLKGPDPCSGHKIVATEDYIYLVGGYASDDEVGHIYKQVWRYNLLLETWDMMDIPEDFPGHLASFGFCRFEGMPQTFLMFGGTGYPFGLSNCTVVHMVVLPSHGDHMVDCVPLRMLGSPIENRYGHSFKCVRNPRDGSKTYYCIGGTDGQLYNLDVYALRQHQNFQFCWEKDATTPSSVNGSYKFDVAVYDDKFFFFGGGTVESVKSLDELYVYDTISRTYSSVATIPDPQHGYPIGRKCHTVTEFEGNVIITGGLGSPEEFGSDPVFDDVWSFELSSRKWKKMNVSLNFPVFFHDAVVTEEGCLYIFGGVKNIEENLRTNALQRLWLKPPSLKTLTKICAAKYCTDRRHYPAQRPTLSTAYKFFLCREQYFAH